LLKSKPEFLDNARGTQVVGLPVKFMCLGFVAWSYHYIRVE